MSGVTRRRFLIAAAGLLSPLPRNLDRIETHRLVADARASESATGFTTFVPDGPGDLLFHHLIDLGFTEKVGLSRVQLQTEPDGAGSDRHAKVAWGFLRHPDLGRALITHVVGSPYDELRDRQPQAHIWPHEKPEADPLTLHVIDGRVVELA